MSIHYYAAQEKKVWSQLGIAFAIVYAVMASLNYIMQLTVVRFSILNKETGGLAMLFAAPVFEGGTLTRWIRALFYANGASVVITILGLVVDSPPVYLLGSLVPWCVVFSLATALLAVRFRRALLVGAPMV